MTYVTGYPQNGQSLGASRDQIRTNLDSTFNTYTINHWNQNQANSGKHNYIQIPIASKPSGNTGVGECLICNQTGGLGGGNNLFFTPPNVQISNHLVQITRNEIPVALANGYTWLPGGLLMQWGVVAPTNATTVTVTFATSNIAFPNNCFNVQVTRQRPTSDPGSSYEFYIDNSTISKTQFQVINRDGHTYGFYWIAIGT